MVHAVIDISGHGLGHVSQLAPIIEVWSKRHPELRLTVRSQAPYDKISDIITVPFDRAKPAPDIGMSMHNPYTIDKANSRHAYEKLHTNLNAVIDDQARHLQNLHADLVISDVGYIALAAAQRLSIPAIAISSLNWADILSAYCDLPEIQTSIRQIYNLANLFIKTEPSLPMNWLKNAVSVGPVGRSSRDIAPLLRQRLGLEKRTRLVAYSLGGIYHPPGPLALPQMDDIFWIVSGDRHPGSTRTDWISFKELDFPFVDIAGSCDAIIAKPGYGTFIEAAHTGTRVLSCERPDWPETKYLTNWLSQYVPLCLLSRTKFTTGDFSEELKILLEQEIPTTAPVLSGMTEACDLLTPFISTR